MLTQQLPTLNLLRFDGLSIFEQLQYEEALLRAGEGNWCILNSGSSIDAIVLGISGKVDEHVDLAQNAIPLIRRFSGGGTVIVDENTCFFTLILDHALFTCSCPKNFLKWAGKSIQSAFSHLPFAVLDNDFVLGTRKIGGNAQHFTNKRRLHHTSFLWDFSAEKMALLKMPSKVPDYRQGRDHTQFCSILKPHYDSKAAFLDQIEKALSSHFCLHFASLADIQSILVKPHRKSLNFVKV